MSVTEQPDASMLMAQLWRKWGAPHFRHTFATELLNARMPSECLRVLLGHTNLEVTRRYARLTDKTREEEYFNAMHKVVNNDFGEYDQCDD